MHMSSFTESRMATMSSKNILAQGKWSESVIQPWMCSVTDLVIITYHG